jgi:Spy/CpxP family protein refolding chaperone
MISWLRNARRYAEAYGVSAGCGVGGGHVAAGWGHGHHSHAGGEHDGDFGGFGGFGGGGFGVRRPLRFLAYKLDLSEKQVTELAKILDDLKTERAQGAVDNRRATSVFADVIGGETFDEARLGQAATERVKSAERLREAIVKALARIHAILDQEQRAKLAYLIRTGALSI